MRGSKGQTGATGCLRALTGGMHSASARAHPCSASLPAGPGGPELQQPPLCRVGDSAAPGRSGSDSRAIPAQTCGCSWPVSLAGLKLPALISAWGPWVSCVPAEHLAQPSHPLCRNSSVQPVFCTHLLAEAAADGSQSKLLTRLPFPRRCVITGSGSEFIQLFAQISSAPFHAAHVTRHTTALSHAAGGPGR